MKSRIDMVLWVIRSAPTHGAAEIAPVMALGWVNICEEANRKSKSTLKQVMASFYQLNKKGLIERTRMSFYGSAWLDMYRPVDKK